jgi:hypothetical protein
MDPSALEALLEQANSQQQEQRHAAIQAVCEALRSPAAAVHTRPVYARLVSSLALEAASVGIEGDWSVFTSAVESLVPSVLNVVSAPVVWVNRAFLVKGLAQVLANVPQYPQTIFRCLFDTLAVVGNAKPIEPSTDDHQRTPQEVRAASEALKQFARFRPLYALECSDVDAGSRTAILKTIFDGQDFAMIESVMASILFDGHFADTFTLLPEHSVESVLKKIREQPQNASRRGGDVLLQRAASAVHRRLEVSADDSGIATGGTTQTVIVALNIIRFMVEQRPRAIRGADSASTLNSAASLLNSLSRIIEITNDVILKTIAITTASGAIAELVTHQPVGEAINALSDLRQAVRGLLRSVVKATLPSDSKTWADTVDFAIADVLLEAVQNAGVATNPLVAVGDDDAVVSSGQLSMLRDLADKALEALAPVASSAANGKRGRRSGRGSNNNSDLERAAVVAHHVQRKADSLLRFSSGHPDAQTFTILQLRQGN